MLRFCIILWHHQETSSFMFALNQSLPSGIVHFFIMSMSATTNNCTVTLTFTFRMNYTRILFEKRQNKIAVVNHLLSNIFPNSFFATWLVLLLMGLWWVWEAVAASNANRAGLLFHWSWSMGLACPSRLSPGQIQLLPPCTSFLWTEPVSWSPWFPGV